MVPGMIEWAMAALAVGAGVAGAEADPSSEWVPLSLDPGQPWSFVGGDWQQDAEGILTAPGTNAEQNLAFYTGQAYSDLEAEFEFRWDWVWTHAGFVCRATDPQHYYLVFFPAVGQQYRAEHFWGAIARVDATGYIKMLSLEMVHGVTSAPQVWHKVRVQVRGPEIRAWVDGRPLRPVQDPIVGNGRRAVPGYVGLATCTHWGSPEMSRFRHLRIWGAVQEAPAFDASLQPPVNYVIVDPGHGSGCGNVVRTAQGEVGVASAGKLWRSADQGRTWSEGPALPGGIQEGLLRTTPDGTLESYFSTHEPPFVLKKAISPDSGQSWSDPQVVSEISFPEDAPFTSLYPTRLLETRSGALLLFAYTTAANDRKILHGRLYPLNIPPIGWNVCLRSTDGGQTWSAPINMDGPPYDDNRWLVYKEASEISAAQTADGRIIALVRPFLSPVMWETWSEDEGQTWTPLARGPFPMYACNNSMIATASGHLIIGGRFPGMGVQVSRDGGMSWEGYQVDTAGWSNGAMFEVEPDVVLWVYGGRGNPEQLRAQRLRITPEGIEPAR